MEQSEAERDVCCGCFQEAVMPLGVLLSAPSAHIPGGPLSPEPTFNPLLTVFFHLSVLGSVPVITTKLTLQPPTWWVLSSIAAYSVSSRKELALQANYVQECNCQKHSALEWLTLTNFLECKVLQKLASEYLMISNV